MKNKHVVFLMCRIYSEVEGVKTHIETLLESGNTEKATEPLDKFLENLSDDIETLEDFENKS